MTVRVVLPSEAGARTEMTMAEAAVEQVRRILALNPVVLTIIYELPDGVVDTASLPPSDQVTRAMVTTMHERYFPPKVEA